MSCQVLANLLANAVKFTERGEVVVRVGLESAGSSNNTLPDHDCNAHAGCSGDEASGRPTSPTSACNAPGSGSGSSSESRSWSNRSASTSRPGGGSPAAEMIHFSVTDTGIGIGRAEADKLFQCFKQGSEAMSRRYGGTGLGLAISRRLTELMHGSIWIDSELGKGSTFHFTMRADWEGAQAAAEGDALGGPVLMPVTSWSSSAFCCDAAGPRASSAAQLDLDASFQSSTCFSASAAAERPSSSSQLMDSMQSMPSDVAAAELSSADSARQLPSPPSRHGASSSSASLSTLRDGFLSLSGRRVLIDVAHGATAMQLLQSCLQLGMAAEIGDSRVMHQTNEALAPKPTSTFEMAVVGMEHAAEAIRGTWKGRPVVVVGERSALPRNLHPLVVFLPLPVKHSRLATALLKSTVLLQWLPNGAKLPDDVMSHKLVQVGPPEGWLRASMMI